MNHLVATSESITTQQESDYIHKADKLPTHSKTSLVAPYRASSNDINRLISEVAVKYGLNYDEFYGTIKGESGLNCNANNGLSVGCPQFILSTWLEFCSNVDDRTDARKSIDCMGKLWARGEQGRWDIFCKLYQPVQGDWRCRVRGL